MAVLLVLQSVLVAALTPMLGFATLNLSSHRGLAGLGFILTLGVGCCRWHATPSTPSIRSPPR